MLSFRPLAVFLASMLLPAAAGALTCSEGTWRPAAALTDPDDERSRWIAELVRRDGGFSIDTTCHGVGPIREREAADGARTLRGTLRGCPSARRRVRFAVVIAPSCAEAVGWVRERGRRRRRVDLVVATPPTTTPTTLPASTTLPPSTAPTTTSTSVTTTTTIPAPWCGNDTREGFEQCDGADLAGATCPAESTGGAPQCEGCRLDYAPCHVCGDADIDPGELCDDGNTVSFDGCSATCGSECGDGIIEPPDQCDDGNRVLGDGCSEFCEIEDPFYGGGAELHDGAALSWGVSGAAPGAAVACADGDLCDLGPAGDGACEFLAFFTLNVSFFVPPSAWASVAGVELLQASLDGPAALEPAQREVVLDAFATTLGTWGGATVTATPTARYATPPVAGDLSGQFPVAVPANATRTVAIRVLNDPEPLVDDDTLTFACTP